MNTQVKTKYIRSSYTGSPQIDGTFGSLVKVLKSTLVDGFNEVSVIRGSYDNSKKQIELFLHKGHGFVTASVVSISGSDNPNLDKQFRVIESRFDSIILHSDEKVDLSNTSNIKVKFAPLGYELVYDDITTTGTACFKSTDGHILKVIDAPLNGYDTRWTKYARVVAGENIDLGGNFIDNKKFPKHPTYPDLELKGDNISDGKYNAGEGRVGYLSWEYARVVDNTTSTYRYTDHTGSFISEWILIGDDRTFYLMIDSMGPAVSSRNIYTFGSLKRDPINSCLLVGADISKIVSNQYHTSYFGVSGRNSFTNSKENIGCFINKTKDGSYQNQLNFNLYHIMFQNSTNNQALVTGSNPNNFYTPITVVDNFKNVRGELRGISQLYNNDLKHGMFLDNYKKVSLRVRYYGTGTPTDVPYLFSLEDWL